MWYHIVRVPFDVAGANEEMFSWLYKREYNAHVLHFQVSNKTAKSWAGLSYSKVGLGYELASYSVDF